MLTYRASGHAAVSADEQHLIVSNLHDGVDIYALPNLTPLHHIKQDINLPTLIVQVGFIPNTLLAFSGTAHGAVQIFDIATGDVSEHVLISQPGSTLCQKLTYPLHIDISYCLSY